MHQDRHKQTPGPVVEPYYQYPVGRQPGKETDYEQQQREKCRETITLPERREMPGSPQQTYNDSCCQNTGALPHARNNKSQPAKFFKEADEEAHHKIHDDKADFVFNSKYGGQKLG